MFLHGGAENDSILQDAKKFLFGSKCLREQVRDDVVKVYEMLEGPCKVKLINTLGTLI